jgi:DNA-binding SARP family transcriptional activator
MALASLPHDSDWKTAPADSTDRATPPLSLWLLNAFDLRHHHQSLHVSRPAQRLLAFLAFQRRPVPRRTAAGALWAELDDQAAAARLRSTLWRLPAPAGTRLVNAAAGRIRLSLEVEVDIHLAEDDHRVQKLEVTHLSGDVLPDWDDSWVGIERERIRQLRLHRLEQLSDRARTAGQFDHALQAALAAAAAEPLRESAHRRVMQAHLAEDNPAEALRQYDLVRQLLRSQLGLAPSAATRSVVTALLGRPLDAGHNDPAVRLAG